MQRQKYGLNPATGRVEHFYEDVGEVPGRAVVGHGRPMSGLASVSPNPHLNATRGEGGKQISGPAPGGG